MDQITVYYRPNLDMDGYLYRFDDQPRSRVSVRGMANSLEYIKRSVAQLLPGRTVALVEESA